MVRLKRSLSEILQGLTVKSTSGAKYSMSRYRGQRGLFDVTLRALTFRNKSRLFELVVYKRTSVKEDSAAYRRLLKQHGHLRITDQVVSVPVLAKAFKQSEDALQVLRSLEV